MSSDEDSEFDEDYVPSDKESNHSEEESDEENGDDDDAPGTKKRKTNGGKVGQVEDVEEKPKTEDELWNEFLGIDSSTSTKESAKQEPKEPTHSKTTALDRSTDSDSSFSATDRTSSMISTNTSAENVGESKSLFEDEVQSNKEIPSGSGSKVGSSASEQSPSSNAQVSNVPTKKPGGMSSVLDLISKDKKATTLQKSKAAWEGYKSKEGITEELSTHNKGKGGYLDKKEFLERADYRQFEQERDIRMSRKRKPMD